MAGEIIRSRGYLPHWEQTNQTYFVTFRLHDSLPAEVLANAHKQPSPQKLDDRQTHKRFSVAIERSLNAGHGACYMKKPEIASLVAQAIKQFDGQRYHLSAWCVMPNHIHVVIRPFVSWKLPSIIHSWKSFTANRANRLLGRSGPFWQREYYDHLVRNGEEYIRVVNYVTENPMKAGLRDWGWTGVCLE
jgi:REP element-mobilizing transposase RayT